MTISVINGTRVVVAPRVKKTISIQGVTVIKDNTVLDTTDFFQTLNKFSELDTEQKKADARINLGVQVFDCGEFF